MANRFVLERAQRRSGAAPYSFGNDPHAVLPFEATLPARVQALVQYIEGKNLQARFPRDGYPQPPVALAGRQPYLVFRVSHAAMLRGIGEAGQYARSWTIYASAL